MLKTGILHPQLAHVLASVRHMDTIVIGDAGLPVPKGVERVDLCWRPGDPKYLDVLEEILKYIVVEKATFATEALKVSPDFHRILQINRVGQPDLFFPDGLRARRSLRSVQ